MATPSARASTLGPNETVLFYPSYGCWDQRRHAWKVAVGGSVFEAAPVSMRKRIMLRLLQRVMRMSETEIESEIFKLRIDGFLAQPSSGRRVAIQFADTTIALRKKSGRSGHFRSVLWLSPQEVQSLQNEGELPNGWLRYHAVGSSAAGEMRGQSKLIQPQGTSIISDIDDTIKHTDVSSRRELLTNTFLREFQSIDGMASLYRQWEATGAAFHYVSSSPWQLYSPLAELCESEGFPAGSFHLRRFRLRDQMIKKMIPVRRRGKAAVILSILRTFPRRNFILVGDSGERDPEIYGAIARKQGPQVSAICIRDLAERPLDAARIRRSFKGLPDSQWRTFTTAEELAELVPRVTLAGV